MAQMLKMVHKVVLLLVLVLKPILQAQSQLDLGLMLPGQITLHFGTGAAVTTKPGNISWSVAMGYHTKVNTGYSVAIGSQAEIAERSDRSSLVGYKTKSSSYYGTLIGAESTIGTSADYSFIGGYKSVVPDNVKWATIVGSESKVSSSGGTAIGRSSAVEADTKYSTALGYSSKVKTNWYLYVGKFKNLFKLI